MLKLQNLKVTGQGFHSYAAWPFLYKQPCLHSQVSWAPLQSLPSETVTLCYNISKKKKVIEHRSHYLLLRPNSFTPKILLNTYWAL